MPEDHPSFDDSPPFDIHEDSPRRQPATMQRTPPHNLDAERAMLGACLLSKFATEDCSAIVAAQDFYRPAHGHIFSAIMDLFGNGEVSDPITVADWLKTRDLLESCGGTATLVDLQADAPGTANASHYAKIVRDHALLRRLISAAGEIQDMAYSLPEDVPEALDRAMQAMTEVEDGYVSTTGQVENLFTMDEFLDRPEEKRAPWAVPGLIRVNWRVMFVAGEGAGKTVLLRQVAMAAAQGLHPLMSTPIDPVTVLIVDLENPDDSIVDVCNPIRSQAQAKAGADYDPNRAWLWWRQDGINLRNRKDRMDLETVLAQVRPQLVCLGPMYKAYDLQPGESDEMPAKEVMRHLDRLRVRYGFGLLMEHHAPHGSSKSGRELRPHGSSVWRRWPELGLSLVPEDSDGLKMSIGRWRGDRLVNSWPQYLTRARMTGLGQWPWVGTWPTGTFNNHGEPAPHTAEKDPLPVMATYELPEGEDDRGDVWVDEPPPDDEDDQMVPF